MEAVTLEEVLASLVGKVVTVINLESFTPTLTGYKIGDETYRAKVLSYEQKVLKILVEFMKDPHKKAVEKAHQFIPARQIKRVTITANECFITI